LGGRVDVESSARRANSGERRYTTIDDLLEVVVIPIQAFARFCCSLLQSRQGASCGLSSSQMPNAILSKWTTQQKENRKRGCLFSVTRFLHNRTDGALAKPEFIGQLYLSERAGCIEGSNFFFLFRNSPPLRHHLSFERLA
jgi:hypothetical protein